MFAPERAGTARVMTRPAVLGVHVSWPRRGTDRTNVPRVDLLLMRLTDGRVSLPGSLMGLPVVRLTTVGARTGKERTVPLLGIRDGETWILVASNFGAERHPTWYHNLRANPDVELTHDGRTRKYVAREATGAERKEYWERAVEVYPDYERYRETAGDRRIPVVVLTPTEG